MDKELQFLIYNTPEENVSVNAVIKDETIWLTQKAMAELFGVGVPAISKHLANIYAKEIWSSTTLMQLFQLDIVLIQEKQQTLEYGQQGF